jgi:hypothetical protein
VKRNFASRGLALLCWLATSASAFVAKNATADVVLWKPENPEDGWEIFTNGRVAVFASYAKGDGTPQPATYADPVLTAADPTMPCDPATNPCTYTSPELHQVRAGGAGYSQQENYPVANPDGTLSPRVISRIDHMRLRSGFVGNVFGLGLRRRLNATTKVTAYIAYTAVVDSDSQRNIGPNGATSFLDAREGYVMIESAYGNFSLGRMGTLFNRGAVVTNFLLLHGYAAGFPGSVATIGNFPTAGMIGFGVLANGFASGIVYSTPVLAGIQLNGGIFDPAQLTGSAVERTKRPRYEFELTVDEPLGPNGNLHLYANGGLQSHYSRETPDIVETARGYGFGGRIKFGPVTVGAGGHRGEGISATYMGIPGESTYNQLYQLRPTTGVFGIGMVTVGKFDLSVGGGQSRIGVLKQDLELNPNGNINPATGFADPSYSWLSTQTAGAGAVVYHVSDYLHLAVDAIFTEFKWNLGERQRINFYNVGGTFTW